MSRKAKKVGWAAEGCAKSPDGRHEDRLVSIGPLYQCRHCERYSW